jgi:hypothetical protein
VGHGWEYDRGLAVLTLANPGSERPIQPPVGACGKTRNGAEHPWVIVFQLWQHRRLSKYTIGAMEAKQPAVETAFPEEEATSRQTYLTLARRVREQNQPILALWPVPAPVKFDELPLHLAEALARLGEKVGLVVPRELWSVDSSNGLFLVSSAGDSVDSITPVRQESSSSSIVVEQTLALAGGRYSQILLDLAGMDDTEVDEIVSVPGVGLVLLVAQGRMSEFALARLQRRIPVQRLVGAVLVEERQRPAVA